MVREAGRVLVFGRADDAKTATQKHRSALTVDVRKARLGLVRRLGRLLWPHEHVGRRQHRGDRQDLVAAPELRRGDDHLGELRVQGQLGHRRADVGELALVVDRAQVVEQLERAHQRLGRGRVHKVKVHLFLVLFFVCVE